MLLKDIFQKPVDRVIEGVIKADDVTAIETEVVEYVLTYEVQRQLDDFLKAYNNYQGANGVWISGFFGSGKSHLLKMLALLMENQEINGKEILEMFLPKCEDNALLKADIIKAVKIPSRSILFNIDQKANVISKEETEALVAVFVKVFDEACGYYGSQPYIAQFERDLDRDSLFTNFKIKLAEISPEMSDWEKVRVRAKRFSKSIDEAYNAVTGQEHSDILDKYRSDYKLSIEDFANNVKRYIDSQGKDFRLNFFVDEAGQYIAGKVKLMTNLQTVAESLATICEGRSWVIVTAQEDMSSILGEMESVKQDLSQGNDFSKIQGRFKNRLKLTSADVAEVIKKRLLLKNGASKMPLKELYVAHSNHLKTMFDFVDGSKRYQNFRDCDDFIDTYPFIPYQFTLFQNAITNLSNHNAFEGRHSSVGERSMLAVFQVVAKQVGAYELNNLASFDLMFEGVRASLKTKIQSSINTAEKHLENKFAIKLLKALFLVKYIKEFKSTVRNIIVLMLDSLDQDIVELTKQINKALNTLEDQSYIQKNGNEYEFLTDDEKDVEEEIKNTDIDVSEVMDEFNKLIFEDILKKSKIRLPDNNQDYPYTRKLDSKQYGREYELTINLITPMHDSYNDETVILMQSAGKDELIVILPDDGRMLKDIQLYKKTQKYVLQNNTQAQTSNVGKILADKANQNINRRDKLRETIDYLLAQAKMFISGEELNMNDAAAITRIENAFYELVRRTYPNLKMLTKSYNFNQIQDIISEKDGEYNSKEAVLNEAQTEIASYIKMCKSNGTRATLKAIINKFEAKPYGWDNVSIICMVAELYSFGKIEAKINSEIIEPNTFYAKFTNSIYYDKIIIHPLAEFTRTQIKNLQRFYGDFMEEPVVEGDARKLAIETQRGLRKYLERVQDARSSYYPFTTILNPAIELFSEIQAKPYDWFLSGLDDAYETLVTTKLEQTDPILRFMQRDNPQRVIYDAAQRLISSSNTNLAYVSGEEITQIEEIMKDPECLKHNKISTLNNLLEGLRSKLKNAVANEIANSVAEIQALELKLKELDEYKKLIPEQQSEHQSRFTQIIESLQAGEYIALIRDQAHSFEDRTYSKILSDIQTATSPQSPGLDKKSVAEISISSNKINIYFNKIFIENDDDLETYLTNLKREYKKQLDSGKKIQVK